MIIKKQVITLIALCTFSAGPLFAQTIHKLPPNFMNDQLSEQLLNQTTALSEPKLVKAQAELLRKHYEALIQTGFNKEEALKITIAIASQDKG